jgi:hypothetical protein|tara:strand:- start:5906 stop:6211 length:306 start_codon:yes stop_codon:yes gene_type:complete
MSYLKQTVVAGYSNTQAKRNISILNGHWKDVSIINYVKRRNLDPRTVTFRRDTTDMSGKGRSTYGAEYKMKSDHTFVKVSESEDIDDSQDIHDIYDLEATP